MEFKTHANTKTKKEKKPPTKHQNGLIIPFSFFSFLSFFLSKKEYLEGKGGEGMKKKERELSLLIVLC